MANKAIKRDITIPRGDTFAFGFECAALGQDLDGAYFSCKENADDSTYVFQKTINDGITKVSSGKYRIRVAPEDTAELDVADYAYDFRIEVNNDVFTIMQGAFKLTQEVTNLGE